MEDLGKALWRGCAKDPGEALSIWCKRDILKWATVFFDGQHAVEVCMSLLNVAIFKSKTTNSGFRKVTFTKAGERTRLNGGSLCNIFQFCSLFFHVSKYPLPNSNFSRPASLVVGNIDVGAACLEAWNFGA